MKETPLVVIIDLKSPVKNKRNKMSKLDFNELRRDYQSRSLRRQDLADNPFDQFRLWLQEALQAQIIEPNAMVLATASSSGISSSRTVLLKHFDEAGLVFFTSYESRKAKELIENPYASVTFLWKEMERQVCVEGPVEKTSVDESKTYFSKRPRKSQLAAWASRQDTVIPSRDALEAEYQRIETLYDGKEVPMPSFWGGFRIKPEQFEFWQGQCNRLHNRFLYKLEGEHWAIQRLSP